MIDMSENVQLYYHKCDDCLTPFSSPEAKIDFCDCNGTVTLMGKVQGDKYVDVQNRPACDGRCTHASGPFCDCACHGANHGTGRVVSVIVKEGKVHAQGLTEQDIDRAQKFRAFRDYAEKQYAERYGSTIALVKSGTRIDYATYSAAMKARNALDKILELRVYEKRQTQLTDFIIRNKREMESFKAT